MHNTLCTVQQYSLLLCYYSVRDQLLNGFGTCYYKFRSECHSDFEFFHAIMLSLVRQLQKLVLPIPVSFRVMNEKTNTVNY